MRRALWMLAFCTGTCAAQASPLGRLFYTEEERARLESQRGQATKQAGQPRTVGTVRHDGVVMRSAGPATWFINGSAHDANGLPSLPARPAGNALQLSGSDGRAVRLRPGERTSIDETGQAGPASGVIEIRTGPAR
ncbi:MAG TPA: hypothetical protein VIO81_00950 [Methyloversatilis sp.]